jgi:hypothetical protein
MHLAWKRALKAVAVDEEDEDEATDFTDAASLQRLCDANSSGGGGGHASFTWCVEYKWLLTAASAAAAAVDILANLGSL